MVLQKWIGTLFLSFSILGAGVCAYLLFLDVHGESSGSAFEQAGVVLFKKNQLQRKPPDLLIWNRLNSHDKIYWYDTIQTEKDSWAVLYVKKGIFLKLGGSSLIQLDHSNDQLSLTLQQGKLDADFSGAAEDSKILINGVQVPSVLGRGKRATFQIQGKDLTSYHRNADGSVAKIDLGSVTARATFRADPIPLSRLVAKEVQSPRVVKAAKKLAAKKAKTALRKVANVDKITWTIRAGIFQKEDVASDKVNDLRDQGLSPYYEQTRMGFVVNVGLFKNQNEATAFLAKMKDKVPGSQSFVIVRTEN